MHETMNGQGGQPFGAAPLLGPIKISRCEYGYRQKDGRLYFIRNREIEYADEESPNRPPRRKESYRIRRPGEDHDTVIRSRLCWESAQSMIPAMPHPEWHHWARAAIRQLWEPLSLRQRAKIIPAYRDMLRRWIVSWCVDWPNSELCRVRKTESTVNEAKTQPATTI